MRHLVQKSVQIFLACLVVLVGLSYTRGANIPAELPSLLVWSGIAASSYAAVGLFRINRQQTCSRCMGGVPEGPKH